MAENSVELQQLQAMADTFIEAEYPYFEELREAFKLLRLTGCRIQEIFDIGRWSIISGYQVSFQPQKGNNTRYITLDSNVDSFISAISGQYKPFLGRTYSQLQNLFQRINPYGKLYSGTKEITNYFFRYLYVRELWEDGLTVTEIANMMGYTSDQAVSNYLNADLSSTIEVPVEPTDPLPVDHIDIFTVETNFDGNTNNFLINQDISNETLSFYFEVEIQNTSDGYIFDLDYQFQNLVFPTIQLSKYNSYNSFKWYLRRRGSSISPAISSNINTNQIFKYFISIDFSTIGSGGILYRDVYLRRTDNGISIINNSAMNQYIQYPLASNFLIGCRKNSLGTISYPFVGKFYKFYFWTRILSNEEIQSLFSL